MTFVETLEQVRELLQSKGRLSYRALKRQFTLDDDYVEDLKAELIDSERVASDEEGKVLVWVGAADQQESENRGSGDRPSSSCELHPTHLADRIRAVAVNDGERKTITALFADLKGSMALIEGLDPEDAQRVIDPALQLRMGAVHQEEGLGVLREALVGARHSGRASPDPESRQQHWRLLPHFPGCQLSLA